MSTYTSLGVFVAAEEGRGTQSGRWTLKWSQAKGDDGIRDYWEEHNRASIDGIPGLPG